MNYVIAAVVLLAAVSGAVVLGFFLFGSLFPDVFDWPDDEQPSDG